MLVDSHKKVKRAYDHDTGKAIWETALPAAAERVPAIYELGGRRFPAICVAAGNGPGAYISFALPER